MSRTNVLPYALGGVAALGVAVVAAMSGKANAKPQPTPSPQPTPGPAPAPTPAPTPAPSPVQAVRTPREAADNLLLYITRAAGSDLGTKQRPNAIIKDAQVQMLGIDADGVYGPQTQARGQQLTNTAWPTRKITTRATTLAPKAKAPTAIPSNPVAVVKAAPASALPATSSAAKAAAVAKPAAVPEVPSAVTPKARGAQDAARDLYAYVVPLVRDNKQLELGTKAAPSDYIAACQRDMRLITSDGIYGPATVKRGKELLGREFPTRNPTNKRVTLAATAPQPAAAKPVLMAPIAPPGVDTPVAKYSPQEAATALYIYLTSGKLDNWGTKAAPNDTIRRAQKDMGSLVADGVYGANTQKRGAALTKLPFPARGAVPA